MITILVLVTLNNLNTRCCIEWGDTIKNCVISYSMWDQINDMNRIHPSTNSVVLVYWWFDWTAMQNGDGLLWIPCCCRSNGPYYQHSSNALTLCRHLQRRLKTLHSYYKRNYITATSVKVDSAFLLIGAIW